MYLCRAGLSFAEGISSVTDPEHRVKVPAHRPGASTGLSNNLSFTGIFVS